MKAALFSLALLGCHVVDESRPPPVEVPEAYAQVGGTVDAADRWWEEFDDPELETLVANVLDDNLELRQAWARLEQAHALDKIARAGWFPSVRAEAGVNHQRQNFNFGDDFATPAVPGFDFEFPENAVITGYPLQLAASYEIDLWGRVRHGKKAAAQDVLQRRDEVEAQATTLAGEVADTWFRLLEVRARKDVLEKQVTSTEEYLDGLEYRFERGLASAADVQRLQGQVAARRRALVSVEPEERTLSHRLALLVGEAPGKAPLHPDRTELAKPPPLPRVGPPSTLIAARPDVRAAFRRVLAADHRVGVAIADRFPRLSLSASTGFQGRNDGLFTNWIYSLSANLTQPIFEGGRRKAEVERTRAVVEEAVAAYGQAVLRAVVEVEDALARANNQAKVIEQLELEKVTAAQTLDRSTADYLAGLADYLAVLDALRSLHALELEEVSARAREVQVRVQLYRALGGRWSTELETPTPLTEEDRDPKMRRAKRRRLREERRRR
jgi:NodT family efflux transporter outer membrane factor (OMF) lipoprotein